MPCHIVVNFGKILSIVSQYYGIYVHIRRSTTNRNEEARSAIRTSECIRKQLQPGVITIHDQFAFWLILQLRKPGVLVS